MSTLLRTLALFSGLLVFAACDSAAPGSLGLVPDGPETGTGTANVTTPTQAGVLPRLISGNVSGNEFVVCKDQRVTNDPSLGFFGRKVDPPRTGTNYYDGFDVTISADLRTLSFTTVFPDAVRIRAVVIKGGPDTHVYNYDGTVLADAGLVSPPNRGGNLPQISHFTICYDQIGG